MKNIYTDYMDTLPTFGCAIANDNRVSRRYTILVPEFYTGNISREETAAIMQPWIHAMHGKFLKLERQMIEKADKREKELGIGKYAEPKSDPKEIEKLKS